MTAPLRATALLGLLLLPQAACDKGIPTDASFTISPDEAMLLVGESVQLTAIGAPRNLTWSSSNRNVASVVAQTGWVTGESRGSATISAVAGSTVAPVDITVQARPMIVVSAAVDFEIMDGDPDPAPVAIDIENSGDVTFEGLALGSTEYDSGQPQGWLSVELDAAPETPSLTLSATAAGLPPGVFAAAVPVIAANAANSPQSIVVTFRIIAAGSPPQLEVVPSNLSFRTFAVGSIPAGSSVTVTNAGDGAIAGLSATIDYVGASGWLEATWEDETDTPARLNVEPTTSALGRSTHTATIRVRSSTLGVSDRTISVSYAISTFDADVAPLFRAPNPGGFPGFPGLPCTQCHTQQFSTNDEAHAYLDNNATTLMCRITGASGCRTGIDMTMPNSSATWVKRWLDAGRPR